MMQDTVLDPRGIKSALQSLFNISASNGVNVTPFIWGRPGIGKSAIVKTIAQEMDLPLVDVRLSMMDPLSLMGVLVPDTKTKESNWLPPTWLIGKKKYILFFDEINSAPPTIQSAAYQIILDRKIGPHNLPEGTIVVAAGNRIQDNGVFYKMPTPLHNRFVHLQMDTSYESFSSYAIKNNIHKLVTGYISYQKGDLIKIPEANNIGIGTEGFPTPRSWEFVSNILYQHEKNPLSFTILKSLIVGCIGEGVGAKFLHYKSNADKIVDIDKYIKGEKQKIDLKLDKYDSAYAFVMALIYQLIEFHKTVRDEKLLSTYDDNFMKVMLNNENVFKKELIIMAAKMLVSENSFDVNVNTPHWEEFFEKMGSIITKVATI